MYAIVDIETTGGFASSNGITEIAISVFDGNQVLERYETLINPGQNIPLYIRGLTGITDEMVQSAPYFHEVAETIFNLLKDKVFVAHSVNFDYSFLKYHLAAQGYNLQSKKLCTIRLGRKIFPGLPSYGLRKLCSSLNIPLINHHRAGGDVNATTSLFALMLQRDKGGSVKNFLNRNSREQQLPPNLCLEDIEKLPSSPGVYYFNDRNGKAIYIGKAKNLRKRVCSHFSGNNPGKQRQEFLRNIHSITFNQCGTELMAFILEAIEIKRLWPAYNRSMKRFEQGYGLFMFEDQKGYLRLAIDKYKKYAKPVYKFYQLFEGYSILRQLIDNYNLCPKLCFVHKSNENCKSITGSNCKGACEGLEESSVYNSRVQQALEKLQTSLPTFAFVDEGRNYRERSCFLLEGGIFYGMGYLDNNFQHYKLEDIKSKLQPCTTNDYICNMILNHASRYPEKVVLFE